MLRPHMSTEIEDAVENYIGTFREQGKMIEENYSLHNLQQSNWLFKDI